VWDANVGLEVEVEPEAEAEAEAEGFELEVEGWEEDNERDGNDAGAAGGVGSRDGVPDTAGWVMTS
jgi:hypothetical protein